MVRFYCNNNIRYEMFTLEKIAEKRIIEVINQTGVFMEEPTMEMDEDNVE